MSENKQNGSVYLKLEQITKKLSDDGLTGTVGYKFTLTPTLDAYNCNCNNEDYLLTHINGIYKEYFEFGPSDLIYDLKDGDIFNGHEVRLKTDSDKTLSYKEEEIEVDLKGKRKGTLELTCGFKSPFFENKTISLTLVTPTISLPEINSFTASRQSKDKIKLNSSYSSPYDYYTLHYYSNDNEIDGDIVSVSESDYGTELTLSCRLIGKDGTVYKQKDISFYVEFPRPNVYMKVGTEIYEISNSYYSSSANITEEAYGVDNGEIEKVSIRDNF